MIFQQLPIAIAVIHNRRFAREAAGLRPVRPGGPIQLYGEFRGLSAPAAADDYERTYRDFDATERKPWTVSPEFGG